MPIDLNQKEFLSLPKMQREAVIFDNVQEIKNQIINYHKGNAKTKTQITIGYIWMFILSVSLGFKRYFPI